VHWIRNTISQAWFDPSLANPLPGVLAIAAVLALAWRWLTGRGRFVDALVLLPVLGVTALALLWFYGDVRESTALRLFLPAAWLTALAPLCVVQRGGRRAAWLLLTAALVLTPLRVRAVVRGEAFPRLEVAHLTDALDELVARLPADRATTLWVGTPAQHLIVKGQAALCPRSFLQRIPELQQLMRQGNVRTIYVLETWIDAAMAGGMGDPREVLRSQPSVVVERIEGEFPITVHRLGR